MTEARIRVAYEDATIEKWKKIRPGEAKEVDNLRFLLQDAKMAVLVQIAFEAGREWQSRHPQADVDFPDYNAPEGP